VFDPRARLQQPVLGGSLVPERAFARRVFARGEWEDRKDPVSSHREPVEHKLRDSKLRVEAGPNAPQLMRVWRHPFQLGVTAMVRAPGGDRARVEPRERLDFSEAFAALREKEDRSFPKATGYRPRLEPRPRLRTVLGGGAA
jgi:hypothetical protein